MPKKKIPQIKKNLKNFLLEEEGKISKKNVAKIAGGTIGLGLALGGAMTVIRPESASGQVACSHGSHGSHGSHNSHGSHGSHASHASHGSHTSHASHGSHSSY